MKSGLRAIFPIPVALILSRQEVRAESSGVKRPHWQRCRPLNGDTGRPYLLSLRSRGLEQVENVTLVRP